MNNIDKLERLLVKYAIQKDEIVIGIHKIHGNIYEVTVEIETYPGVPVEFSQSLDSYKLGEVPDLCIDHLMANFNRAFPRKVFSWGNLSSIWKDWKDLSESVSSLQDPFEPFTLKETVYVIANTQESFNTFCYGRDDVNYIRLTESMFNDMIANSDVSVYDPQKGWYVRQQDVVDLRKIGTVKILFGGIDSNVYHKINKMKFEGKLIIDLEQEWGI